MSKIDMKPRRKYHTQIRADLGPETSSEAEVGKARTKPALNLLFMNV
jgi:hypothetical protein